MLETLVQQRRPNRDYYDEFAAGYEKRRHHGYHALIDRLEIAATSALRLGRARARGRLRHRDDPRGGRAARRAAVGLDLSPGMLAKAHARGLRVVHGSVTDLPFADGDVRPRLLVQGAGARRAHRARDGRDGARGRARAATSSPSSTTRGRCAGSSSARSAPTTISTATNDDAVFTRYDSLPACDGYLPPSCASSTCAACACSRRSRRCTMCRSSATPFAVAETRAACARRCCVTSAASWS